MNGDGEMAEPGEALGSPESDAEPLASGESRGASQAESDVMHTEQSVSEGEGRASVVDEDGSTKVFAVRSISFVPNEQPAESGQAVESKWPNLKAPLTRQMTMSWTVGEVLPIALMKILIGEWAWVNWYMAEQADQMRWEDDGGYVGERR